MTNQIKIYVANLGKYNEGKLVGEWFTLPYDIKDIMVKIGLATYDNEGNYIHGVEEDGIYYEEWAIHDYEAPFNINEYSSIKKLNEIAEKMEDMDEMDINIAFELLNDGIVSDFDEALESMEDVIVYHECRNMGDVAYKWHKEIGTDMNAPLMNYVDWDRLGRDMGIEGTFFQLDDNTIVEYVN
ncbi:antirestriction protein ArdA [Virgibacillus sp. M23]|uniref:antirestriction protein ArdA n=1 Tax=Virgibacillus sp. M23 TaxID=3079030 RepID=UPI002A91495E|nr:antirestriction protein ArdA [Virgibacillus sp. M23]MDY7043656.1 antirestriction protein ArdA [Virgibacillus sp. M23]